MESSERKLLSLKEALATYSMSRPTLTRTAKEAGALVRIGCKYFVIVKKMDDELNRRAKANEAIG